MASFSVISFSPVSFDVGQEQSPGTTPKKSNRWRAWIRSLARDFRNFFKIKQRPPEPEEVEIPAPQPPKTVTILAEPPTMETKLETLNDKWSVVASAPPVGKSNLDNQKVANATIYPLILNPLTTPLIQTKVTLPKVTRQPLIPPYRVGEGSHIESQLIEFKKPRNRSKTASTINTLMILLEIESKL